MLCHAPPTVTAKVRAAAGKGNRPILWGVEAGHPHRQQFDVLRDFCAEGVRYIDANATTLPDRIGGRFFEPLSAQRTLTDSGREVDSWKMKPGWVLVEFPTCPNENLPTGRFLGSLSGRPSGSPSHSCCRAWQNSPRPIWDRRHESQGATCHARRAEVSTSPFQQRLLSQPYAEAQTALPRRMMGFAGLESIDKKNTERENEARNSSAMASVLVGRLSFRAGREKVAGVVGKKISSNTSITPARLGSVRTRGLGWEFLTAPYMPAEWEDALKITR